MHVQFWNLVGPTLIALGSFKGSNIVKLEDLSEIERTSSQLQIFGLNMNFDIYEKIKVVKFSLPEICTPQSLFNVKSASPVII